MAARRRPRHAANNLGSFSADEAVWIKSAAWQSGYGPHPNDFVAVVRYVPYVQDRAICFSLAADRKSFAALHFFCGIEKRLVFDADKLEYLQFGKNICPSHSARNTQLTLVGHADQSQSIGIYDMAHQTKRNGAVYAPHGARTADHAQLNPALPR